MRIITLSLTLITAAFASAQGPMPSELTLEEQQLAAEARKLNVEALQLYQQGKAAEAVATVRQSLERFQRVYATSKYPDGHPDLAASINNMGIMLNAAGSPKQALPFFEQSLAMRRKLYPESRYPDGHPALAMSINNVGGALRAAGAPEKALPYFEQAVAMYRQLYPESKFPDGHANLAVSLENLGFTLEMAGLPEKALSFYEQALAMSRKLFPESRYPDGHPQLAKCLRNLGSGLEAAGAPDKALPYVERALAMYRKQYPESKYPGGHPDLASGLESMGSVLEMAGSAGKALSFDEEALAMRRKLYPESKYPDGHEELANSLNNLGSALRGAGWTEKALPYCEQALAMRRKLYAESRYPDGHPYLAVSLNNMGFALQSAGAPDKALPYYEQALAMYGKVFPESKFPAGHPQFAITLNNLGFYLQAVGAADKALPFLERALAMRLKLYPESKYPEGHPEIAQSLNNLGAALAATGSPQQAQPHYEQALAMRRKLYPAGHPELAQSLSNLSHVLLASGSPEKALPLLEQTLAMQRKLFPDSRYPDGHPDRAQGLSNLGFMLHAAGAAEKALPYFEQALAMQRVLDRRQLLAAAEADVLSYLQTRPLTRDGYLLASMQVPGTEAATYAAVWQSKAAVSRVLELRHAAARAAGPGAAEALNRLKENHRDTERVLQDTRRKDDERDKELARLADERAALERRLAKDLPIVTTWDQRDKQSPADLAKALPAGAAFVDLLAWYRVEVNATAKGKSPEKLIPSYLAFIVAPGRGVQRVDLGPTDTIGAAVHVWRQAIEGNTSSTAADKVATLIWQRIATALPPGTKTLYLAADGDLARVPWAALPIGKNRVLLEDYALATVPHGPFLHEALATSSPVGDGPDKGTLVALGDVTYDSTWPALPGTRTEITSVAALSPGVAVALTKADATMAKLADALPRARYAHLATHGEFQADAFAAEQERLLAAKRDWAVGKTQETLRVAAKNPLGYVGLVLAGGERMSGLSILDLNLRNLKLVTLSACETGVGEYTGGKGVENLQAAFHLAGCPNVVASLWKVNDAATAALMTQFYHELWVNKKPPIEALREAQLTIYRHPERVPALAGERGRPALDAAAKLGSATKPDDKAKTTPTKLWAAFVLSGVEK